MLRCDDRALVLNDDSGRASYTVTSNPRCARPIAARHPTGPAPTTAALARTSVIDGCDKITNVQECGELRQVDESWRFRFAGIGVERRRGRHAGKVRGHRASGTSEPCRRILARQAAHLA